MAIFGVTTNKYVNQLESLGLTMLEPNDTEGIPKIAKVFIYDHDGVFDKTFLKALITAGCTIVYAYENDGVSNVKFLAENGVYNCYSDVRPDVLTAAYISNTLDNKLSYTDIKPILETSTTVSSLNVCIEELDKFLKAIDDKDEETIKKVFDESFSIFLDFKTLVSEKVRECEKHRKSSILKQDEVYSLNAEIEKYKQKLKDLAKTGRLCEDDNKRLSDALTKIDAELKEKDEDLKTAKEKIDTLIRSTTELEAKNTELNNRLIEAVNNANMITARNEKLMKQLDTVSTSMNQNFVVDDIEVKLSNTGSVTRILYIKVIDFVPYIMSSLKAYPKYIANKKKKEKGCAFLLITPKNSTLLEQYKSTNPVLTDSTQITNCKDTMYILEGFDTLVEKFIQQCECDFCLILDMSLKKELLTTSFRQKNLYVVNNSATIDSFRLNPKECISFTNLTDSGVIAHIPALTEEEITSFKGTVRLRDSLYTFMDNHWK